MPTVLVVEDSPDILSAITETLTEEGWAVVGVRSAEEALPVAGGIRCDVVLCDVLLASSVDGPALREKMTSLGLRQVPFVFMTASTRDADRLQGEFILRKPFAVSEVVELLSAAITRGAALFGAPPLSEFIRKRAR